MAKRIVDEHGGRITIDSQVGKGSDFRISLPA
jgi:signal transduction histidine kinase